MAIPASGVGQVVAQRGGRALRAHRARRRTARPVARGAEVVITGAARRFGDRDARPTRRRREVPDESAWASSCPRSASRSPILLGLLGLFAAMALFARNYIKVPPSTVAIFYGRKHTLIDEKGNRSTVGFRVVRGGAALRVPVLEQVAYLSLNIISIPLRISARVHEGRRGGHGRGGRQRQDRRRRRVAARRRRSASSA